ncbi:Transcription factor SFP1 [Lasiodiplodia theobromae]|uniref:Transcription factor SFP1 n=1 Tax=Lasiodiplodia theobromae TaxID=45133 RepID=A0A5N5D2P8_9PEZI|nr:Transcription factor SFP1 [Lasiodiplodia theobromae]
MASSENGRSNSFELDEESREKGMCPVEGCGRVFRDLNAHMLTHIGERPEKCPITTCEYHIKGFARKYDMNRHTLTHYKGTMVCGFCSGSGSAAEKSFNRVDVFKRHLISVHGVEQTIPNSRKKTTYNGTSAAGTCSTCSVTFSDAREFYLHLDDCILRVIQQADPSEAINQQLLSSIADDEDVKETLNKHSLPNEMTNHHDDDSLPPQSVRGSPQVYANYDPTSPKLVGIASIVTTVSDESHESLSQPNQRTSNSEKLNVEIKIPAAEPRGSMSRNQSLAEVDEDENEDWSDAVGVDIEPEEQIPFKPFKCPVIGCEKAYKNQNGLKYHKQHGHQNQQLMENADGTFSVIDPETSVPYPSTIGMEKEKPHRCETCGKRYKNLNGLKYHRAHSPPCNLELRLNGGEIAAPMAMKQALMDQHYDNPSPLHRPFKQGSPLAPPSGPSDTFSSTQMHQATAEQSREPYLPKMEANFMKDFNCCGLTLDSLHELLQHYEEVHGAPSATTQRPSISDQSSFDNGGKMQRQSGTSDPRTISPKNALLDYFESEEDSMKPLFADASATDYDNAHNSSGPDAGQ